MRPSSEAASVPRYADRAPPDAAPEGMPAPPAPGRLELVLLVVYLLLLIAFALHHELWRDQVRPLNIVRESASLPDLLHRLRAEGHPVLWYLVLYAGHAALGHHLAIQPLTVAMAAAAAGVFAVFSPFTKLEKTLFLLGLVPLYGYPFASSGGYPLAMLLLFIFCVFYRARFRRITPVAAALFLLSQTIAAAFVLSASLLFALLIEVLLFPPPEAEGRRAVSSSALGLVALGMVITGLRLIPEGGTLVTDAPSRGLEGLRAAIPSAVLSHGAFAALAFGSIWFPVRLLAAWTYAFLLRKPTLVLALMGILVGLQLQNDFVYPARHWHMGFVYLAFVAVLWMDAVTGNQWTSPRGELGKVVAFARWSRAWVVPLLFASQVMFSIRPVLADWRLPYSSSRAFGNWIRARPELRDAILVGEPDYFMESVAYYVDNPIFLPREERFGKVVSFTVRNRQSLTLEELLETARRLQTVHHKPVLITLGHPLDRGMLFFFSYGKEFVLPAATVDRFVRETIKVASFREVLSGQDESYDVYRLKGSVGE